MRFELRRSAIILLGQFWLELAIAAAFVAAMLAISLATGLPVQMPNSQSAMAIGMHYLYPFVAVALFFSLASLFGTKRHLAVVVVALLAYAIVLWAHFNVKLWSHYLNPNSFDAFYWMTDQWIRPVIDFCMDATDWLVSLHPYMERFYVLSFVLLFVISFTVHAINCPRQFREVFIAALLLQGLGGFAYSLFPAVGPFIYETGPVDHITRSQLGMYAAYEQLLVQGIPWLKEYGQLYFVAALGAMPSLHSASTYLFTYFIWKYDRKLLIVYAPVLVLILVMAIGTRWHYAIDLPVGIALAQFCIWGSPRLIAWSERLGGDRSAGPLPEAAMAIDDAR
jgi:hypothetical protein